MSTSAMSQATADKKLQSADLTRRLLINASYRHSKRCQLHVSSIDFRGYYLEPFPEEPCRIEDTTELNRPILVIAYDAASPSGDKQLNGSPPNFKQHSNATIDEVNLSPNKNIDNFARSALSAFEKPSEFASQFSLKSVTESLAPIAYCCGCKKKPADEIKKEPSKYFDIQLLKDPIYLVILLSNCTCAISYTNFIILVPAYGLECGFDKSHGAYLLSIISAFDLVGRIGGSALSDVVTTPKRYFFITGLLLSGISLAILRLLSSYSTLSIFCSIFSIASGINVEVTALVMTERLMSSYGISLFVNGIVQLIGPPVCGFWYEYSKSYKPLFITFGFILVGGSSLWSFVPIINRSSRRAAKKKMNVGEKA